MIVSATGSNLEIEQVIGPQEEIVNETTPLNRSFKTLLETAEELYLSKYELKIAHQRKLIF